VSFLAGGVYVVKIVTAQGESEFSGKLVKE